ARTPTVAATTAGHSPLEGDWVADVPEPAGTKVSLGFKEDGSLLWVVEDAQYGESILGKYRTDSSTQPQSLEVFDFPDGEMKAQTLRGIFELQSDGRLKLDFPKEQQEQATMQFTKDALLFSKATSPIVRSTKPTPT